MQRIADLVEGSAIEIVRGEATAPVSDITDDSRQVRPGSLFIARSGVKLDGREFVPDAIARGAAAVLCRESDSAWPRAAILRADDIAQASALVASRFFHDPSRALKVIGITGTNGKTTTAYIVRNLLEFLGVRCALMGTVEVHDGASRKPADLTTPGVIDVNRWLAAAVANGCGAAVMEVSSHALAQRRVAGVRFAAGVFTNLSGDHLDYHGTMDEYARAKAGFFASLDEGATAVVNIDDAFAPVMLQPCGASVIRCSMRDERAGAFARIVELSAQRTRAVFAGEWGRFEADLPLVGGHNVENALHALCSVKSIVARCGADDLCEAVSSVAPPPGRLERVTGPDDEYSVLVDYAHSDAALTNVLSALRPLVPAGGRLWTVFGCGGDRDRTKRPRMARAACALSDRVIVTSDNPRTEEPLSIIGEIFQGVPVESSPAVMCVPDRRRAIHEAIAQARAGDVVLVAGKGHEDYQIIGTRKFPFDDRIIAREALRARRRELAAA